MVLSCTGTEKIIVNLLFDGNFEIYNNEDIFVQLLIHAEENILNEK